jgi:transcriptional regulator with XRE-family HTH domain
MLMNMSQEKLGELLGVTFQQVQKYEKGANRIGASRLYEMSRVLEVPVQYFFNEMPDAIASGRSGFSEDAEPFEVKHITQDSIDLNRAFDAIKTVRARKTLVETARTFAEMDGG